jgi:hypothetical protein
MSKTTSLSRSAEGRRVCTKRLHAVSRGLDVVPDDDSDRWNVRR